MATWEEIRNWIVSRGPITKEGPGWLILELAITDGRTQLIEVQYQQADHGLPALVAFFSHIGKVDEVDDATLRKALMMSARGPVTLKTIIEGPSGGEYFMLTVAHYTPADTLDEVELAWPIGFISTIADMMENALVGGDEQ